MNGDRPLLCGVDAGTSQIRALVFELDGTQVAAAAQATPTRTLGADHAEHDAEELWRCTVSVLRQVVASVPDPKAIRGVAVGSMGEAGVLLAPDGHPVAPLIAWYDTRTIGELDWLMGAVGFERLHRITGLCPDPTFSLLKLLWVQRQDSERFAAAAWWLNVADYLAWRLSGERATDFSLASRTLMLDLERRSWAQSILELAALPEGILPPIRPSGTRIGTITPEAAAATGLAADCAVGVGGHDHVCGLLAAGADAPGVLLDSLGTAEALTMVRDRPIEDAAVGWDGYNQGVFVVDQPYYYVFGGLPTAAGAVEWFREMQGGIDHATLIAEAEAAGETGESLLFLPHLRLGSPPFPDPVGRGAFLGISSATRRGTLFRAVLEGIALDAGNMLKAMLRHLGTGPPERTIAIGGSIRNPLLMRLKASVYGTPLEIPELPDTTCLGAALLGGLAAGLFPNLAAARSELRIPVRTVTPDPSWDDARRLRRQASYAAAYAALRPLHARLLDD